MAIYDNLTKYHQIEANNLKGLQPGFVIAQAEIASGATFNQAKFNVVGENMTSGSSKPGAVANGHIVQFDATGIKDVADATAPLYIVYNEPLNTIIDKNDTYATHTDRECLRLVQLIPGDEWMSDLDILNESYPGSTHLEGRIVEVTSESGMSKDDWFGVKTLADGTAAKHYMFVK